MHLNIILHNLNFYCILDLYSTLSHVNAEWKQESQIREASGLTWNQFQNELVAYYTKQD